MYSVPMIYSPGTKSIYKMNRKGVGVYYYVLENTKDNPNTYFNKVGNVADMKIPLHYYKFLIPQNLYRDMCYEGSLIHKNGKNYTQRITHISTPKFPRLVFGPHFEKNMIKSLEENYNIKPLEHITDDEKILKIYENYRNISLLCLAAFLSLGSPRPNIPYDYNAIVNFELMTEDKFFPMEYESKDQIYKKMVDTYSKQHTFYLHDPENIFWLTDMTGIVHAFDKNIHGVELDVEDKYEKYKSKEGSMDYLLFILQKREKWSYNMIFRSQEELIEYADFAIKN